MFVTSIGLAIGKHERIISLEETVVLNFRSTAVFDFQMWKVLFSLIGLNYIYARTKKTDFLSLWERGINRYSGKECQLRHLRENLRV